MQYKVKSVRLKNFKCFDGSKYIHYFAGKELLETLNPLADMVENGIENKLCK